MEQGERRSNPPCLSPAQPSPAPQHSPQHHQHGVGGAETGLPEGTASERSTEPRPSPQPRWERGEAAPPSARPEGTAGERALREAGSACPRQLSRYARAGQGRVRRSRESRARGSGVACVGLCREGSWGTVRAAAAAAGCRAPPAAGRARTAARRTRTRRRLMWVSAGNVAGALSRLPGVGGWAQAALARAWGHSCPWLYPACPPTPPSAGPASDSLKSFAPPRNTWAAPPQQEVSAGAPAGLAGASALYVKITEQC